eukprot:GHVH01004755.1.p1 GENE.GHVH01004755.1~~GHVH01004755.1.p1  ORF type:complete len:216 (+),score=25.44 GHVH01004755.1:87-650(+)
MDVSTEDSGDVNMESSDSSIDKLDTQSMITMITRLSHVYVSPLLDKMQYRMNEIDNLTSRPPINVSKLLLYSQRLTCLLEPPPLYNDPKGEDADCYPGRKFPCPDSAMLDQTIFSASHKHLLAPVLEHWSTLISKQLANQQQVEVVTSQSQDYLPPQVEQPKIVIEQGPGNTTTSVLFHEDSSSDDE